jgi:hypothetical protein
MKCDRCCCQFPAHEASTATYNEAVKPYGKRPYTEIRAMTLCPDCAAGQASLLRFYFWLFAIFIFTGIAIALYSSLR